MDSPKEKTLLGLNQPELAAITDQHGEPAYRTRQLSQAIYRDRVSSLDEISTLPKDFRSWLAAQDFVLGRPEIEKKFVSNDGTVRYLIRLLDGNTVETVWMPEGDGGEAGDGSEDGNDTADSSRGWRRATICVSSQVGCAVNCQFCLTALLGISRNLSAGEIVGQVIAVLEDQHANPEAERINLVFMGMGEPFLNYDNFMKAVRLLAEEVAIPPTRMTVSTAGIVPRIYDFGAEPVRPKLAISLTAPNDAVREALMPINRKWDVAALMQAARQFPLRPREKLTFEYVLLGGVNDSPAQARELAELMRGIRAKVNLIAWNPGPGINFAMPADEAVRQFQNVLIQSGIPAFVRKPRGRDIYAACGQLKRTTDAGTI